MSIDFVGEGMQCIHIEKRLIERISRGLLFDKRPDLVVWICHFPLPYQAGIQCRVLANGAKCPHSGPYSSN